MPLSRRQFFRRFWGPSEKGNPQRIERCHTLEMYVRTHLLPYDFSLTAEQEADLFDEVRFVLDSASDEELYSLAIRGKIEECVDMKIQPWREESRLRSQAERIHEIRQAAPDYVTTFLSLQATPTTIEALKHQFGTEDAETLESELKQRISAWIADTDDEQIVQYDVFTVKELVFAQLRSWC